MGSVQIVTTVLAAAITIVAVGLAVRAVLRMVSVIRLGQPDPDRFDQKAVRLKTMLKETVGHTRMLKWSVVGASHWFVMVGFMVLSLLVLEAYFEVVSTTGAIPILHSLAIWGLVTEVISILGTVGILILIGIRIKNRPTRPGGRSRFTGSTMWQGYFVEAVVLIVLILGMLIRGFQVSTGHFGFPVWAAPVSHALGSVLPDWPNAISIVALIKICVSMTWMIVIALNVTMGVAWHRFSAFFNIFFKRKVSGAGSGLGGLKPMMSNGKPLDFEEADPETDQFGVGQVEQFTWKGLLDFTTCTECGRCQSQCPAWNTAKPLSPKLLILNLRDHAYAKAPYLLAGGGKDLTGEEKATAEQLAGVDVLAMAESERPLIGTAEEGGIIDPDVLWSCTTCGACVEQCPVDIEHIDHIVDMRRYQVMIESSFPAEAGVMLRNLENKGNPWGAPQNTREDWTKGLDFEVPRVGEVEDFEYLFWVGCAGAFEDRAKKTTRAVATLLHEAAHGLAQPRKVQDTSRGGRYHNRRYATLAADGKHCEPIPVQKIVDLEGNKLDIAQPRCEQVVSKQVARGAIDAARCPVGDRSDTTKCNGQATVGMARGMVGKPLAGKTGTTDGEKVASLALTTRQLAVAGILTDPDWPDTNQRMDHNIVNPAVIATMRDALQGKKSLNFPGPNANTVYGDQRPIPNVSCQSVETAQERLRGAGFRVSVSSSRVASRCPAGQVAGTSPGDRTVKGGLVEIQISSGPGRDRDDDDDRPRRPGRGN